jgi:hypothetical protein
LGLEKQWRDKAKWCPDKLFRQQAQQLIKPLPQAQKLSKTTSITTQAIKQASTHTHTHTQHHTPYYLQE